MPHSVTLITTISAALVVAFVMGFIATKLRLPALVGYLLAGIIIGPATPGFVANLELSKELAEIGVILLMFGVGLHFSVDELLSVKKIALPGAIAQIAAATLLSMVVAHFWGWSIGASLVFGLALSVASTVVLLRALEDRNILETVNGKIAVGWLVVEDLVTVLVLVLLPTMAASVMGQEADGGAIFKTLFIAMGKVAIFVALMLVVGKRFFPWLLLHTAKTGSRELFTLCVLGAAMGIAFGSAYLFGVSFALGAFFAGMVMRESSLSQRAAAESLPLRDAFSVLFFVSVGMLFDPYILVEKPLHVLSVVAIIVFGKSIAAFLIVLFFKYPLNTALLVSASLAQIGEFSFILAGMGVALGILPLEGQNYILAGALISIAINPLVFNFVNPIRSFLLKFKIFAENLDKPKVHASATPIKDGVHNLKPQVVLIGYGRVGKHIAKSLSEKNISFSVLEQTREKVEKLGRLGVLSVCDDGTDLDALASVGIGYAEVAVLAIPDAFQASIIVDAIKKVNPNIKVVVRTHSEEAADIFVKQGIKDVFIGEYELGVSMIRRVTEMVAKKHWKDV